MTENISYSSDMGNEIVDAAIDMLNTGELNFSLYSSNARYASALKNVEVRQGEKDYGVGTWGYVDKGSYDATGLTSGIIYTYPDHAVHNTFFSKNLVGNTVGHLIHETLHMSTEIDAQRAAIVEH
ncbi:hypothetical protein [uncultured Celeribacter sp.]|uniref:hypothetical protein n=1 Tax=uncultured Celeribacter sp. TaxID=1303376 RepID=UPI002AA8B76E|nr:hypothetical protein [uncultured Celeribacter sp.]